MWEAANEVWGVRPSDSVTALSTDKGQTWEVRTTPWTFQPRMFDASPDGVVTVFGTVGPPTADGKQASRVALSRDRGKTWRTVDVPVDIPLGMVIRPDGTISVGGKCLPRAPMKEDHWFLLPNWEITTTTGAGWTKMGDPFLGPPKVGKRPANPVFNLIAKSVNMRP